MCALVLMVAVSVVVQVPAGLQSAGGAAKDGGGGAEHAVWTGTLHGGALPQCHSKSVTFYHVCLVPV